MSAASKARAAGRGLVRGAAGTGMAMAGGAVYYGAHAITVPSLYGSDSANVPKRFWYMPVAGIIGGHLLSRFPKVAAVGLGLVGGATAIGVEQAQMALSIKKNAAASGTVATNTGALLEPGDMRSANQLAPRTSNDAGILYGSPASEYEHTGQIDESGAVWGAPRTGYHEAAGLSL